MKDFFKSLSGYAGENRWKYTGAELEQEKALLSMRLGADGKELCQGREGARESAHVDRSYMELELWEHR